MTNPTPQRANQKAPELRSVQDRYFVLTAGALDTAQRNLHAVLKQSPIKRSDWQDDILTIQKTAVELAYLQAHYRLAKKRQSRLAAALLFTLKKITM